MMDFPRNLYMLQMEDLNKNPIVALLTIIAITNVQSIITKNRFKDKADKQPKKVATPFPPLNLKIIGFICPNNTNTIHIYIIFRSTFNIFNNITTKNP